MLTLTRSLAIAAILSLTPAVVAAPQATGADGTNVGGAAPPTTQRAPGEKGAPTGPTGKDVKSSDTDSVAARKIAQEESKLEKRKAKIARLRELAQTQGNAQRLRALDELERRLMANHERKVAKWRGRLGEERYKKVRGKVKHKGKGKSGEQAKGKSGEQTKGKSGEQTKGKSGEQTKGKSGEQTKGKSGEQTRGKPADPGKGKGKGKANKGRGDES